MQEPTFLILSSLVDRPRHGYALLGEVERLSGGRVQLRVGTLYAALDRLCATRLVEIESEEVVSGRPRRTYRVSAGGVQALREETERMLDLATKAQARLRRRVMAVDAGPVTGVTL